MSDVNDLCDLMESQNFGDDEYTVLICNRDMLYKGIPKEFQKDFLRENDGIIQNYLKCLELNDIDFLREMMTEYLSICDAEHLIPFKLDMLSAIYNSIYDILNS